MKKRNTRCRAILLLATLSLGGGSGCDFTPAAWLNSAFNSGVATLIGRTAQEVTDGIFGPAETMTGGNGMNDQSDEMSK